VNTESADNAIQAMRDQGIRDACEGRVSRAWFESGVLCYRGPDGLRYLLTTDTEYREAFAYARAYSAERGE
jgi:hypothetical protein